MPAGVQLSTRLIERPVGATRLDSVHTEMVRDGPAAAVGQYPGTTIWRVNWSYEYDRQPGRCALRQVGARVDAEVHVPRWDPKGATDSAARAWWNDYLARLLEHERGHVRLAADAGGEIVRALRPIEAPSCAAASAQANQEGERILRDLATRQSAYDRDTHHGMVVPGPRPGPGGRVPFHGRRDSTEVPR
ncbi:MAG TPA: DUF922 domain-containing protein [Gemmatimonadaceae bacterium]|nr:DUF922 domain-containing protein [Gemmatimonadaceae bacterium]